MKASILVTVGTDHHPFDRLVAWVEGWVAARDDVDVFVQHGTAAPPSSLPSAALLDPAELRVRLAAASAVVCHGGLSSIMEVRAAGLLPLVIARDPALGEHVDGHQQRFTRHEADHGRIRLIETEADLAAALDLALRQPGAFALDPTAGDVSAAVDAVAHLVDDLLVHHPARHSRRAAR